ncbi:MAG: hypothetical protein K0S58_3183 [Nitrospira sp.]|nr:hypothetical protein [Nitrospira sp.]
MTSNCARRILTFLLTISARGGGCRLFWRIDNGLSILIIFLEVDPVASNCARRTRPF